MLSCEPSFNLQPIYLPSLSPRLCAGRVLIAEAWNVTPHLETGLEIAIRLAAAGYRIDYFHFGGLLSYVEFYNSRGSGLWEKALGYSASPESKGIEILKTISSQYRLDLRVLSQKGLPKIDAFTVADNYLDSIDNLKCLTYRGFTDMGLSVASSLVTLTKNSQVHPREHLWLCNSLVKSFIQSFSLVRDCLAAQSYSSLVVFNGRFASIKGAVLAAKQYSLPIFYHERGASRNSFFLNNFQPHDRLSFQADVCKTWSQCKDKECSVKIARNFFESKRKGIELDWTSFVGGQKFGLSSPIARIAKEQSHREKLLVYFTSSDDEFVASDDAFQKSIFEWKDQRQAVQSLARVAKDLGYSLIVRVHPHLEDKSQSDRHLWNKLSFLDCLDNIFVVESGSPVSTYELIEAADVVIAYGSTVGIEGIYWGRPLILLGDSFYDEIGATVFKPLTENCLRNLLIDIDAISAESVSALPYGYYMSTFGEDFQLYRPNNLLSGRFIGRDLSFYPRTLRHRAAQKLKKILWSSYAVKESPSEY